MPRRKYDQTILDEFYKPLGEMNRHSWTTYVGEDPDKQWNECNGEWKGDIQRLAKIHGV